MDAVRMWCLAGLALLGGTDSSHERLQFDGQALASRKSVSDVGRALFVKVLTVEDGLGPQLNARSCLACHAGANDGDAPRVDFAMVRLSMDIVDPSGGHVVRQFSSRGDGRISRRIPPGNTVLRRPTTLFGLGQLEQVPDAVLRDYADPDDRDGDGISGRVAQLQDGIGRYGWKGRFATLEQVVAAALVVELGLTSTRYPFDMSRDRAATSRIEIDDHSLHALTEFVRSLPPVPNDHLTELHRNGEDVFRRAGCGNCHRPTLQLRPAAVDMDSDTIHPYTDLLLHDMGPALADGLVEGDASAQEFRTAPLWGLGRTGPPYLHDGRAASVHEAILAHGGEGQRSMNAYRALRNQEREALLGFIASR